MDPDKRKFIKQSLAAGAGLAAASIPMDLMARSFHQTSRPKYVKATSDYKPLRQKASIRFSVIGLNHGHIYGQVGALLEGGGELVAVYAKEPELLSSFTRRYPDVKIAASEDEILEDPSIQMIASASIASERAPLGIRAMKNGKDFMADKPGITSFEQLVSDVVNRTETAMTQAHCFLASELALKGQANAVRL